MDGYRKEDAKQRDCPSFTSSWEDNQEGLIGDSAAAAAAAVASTEGFAFVQGGYSPTTVSSRATNTVPFKMHQEESSSSPSLSSPEQHYHHHNHQSSEKRDKRREQVRKAQRHHRQRKANYIQQLESDIVGLREQIQDAERETMRLGGENWDIRGHLFSPSPPSSSSSSSTTTSSPFCGTAPLVDPTAAWPPYIDGFDGDAGSGGDNQEFPVAADASSRTSRAAILEENDDGISSYSSYSDQTALASHPLEYVPDFSQPVTTILPASFPMIDQNLSHDVNPSLLNGGSPLLPFSSSWAGHDGSEFSLQGSWGLPPSELGHRK